MPLHAIQLAFVVLEGCDGGTLARGSDLHPGRRLGDRVTMGHPDGLLGCLAVEQSRGDVRDEGLGRAVLAETGLRDRAPECLDHRLEPVTHAEHRHPRRQQRDVQRRCAIGIDRCRTAREHDRGRVLGQHLGRGHGVRDDLAIDVGLAHPAGDQLGVLRPEVDDKNRSGGQLGERFSHGATLPARPRRQAAPPLRAPP